MENYKLNIANSIKSLDWNDDQSATIEKIRESIDYAWNNWDAYVIKIHFEGEKPDSATDSFIDNWLDNEGLEADCYDIEFLKSLF